ncbi:MAG TPA: ATP-binding protein [Candidatus Limnocylindrales bacterium]|nr:ATP-binding protein [Candidatus Limnocylindrales bacterium]
MESVESAGVSIMGRTASRLEVEQLLDAHPNAVFLATGDGRIEYANGRLSELVGMTVTAIRGANVADLVVNASRNDARLRRADGGEVAVDLSSTRIETADGPVDFAIVVDATARRRTEAQGELIAQLATAVAAAATADEVGAIAIPIAMPAIGAYDAALALVDERHLVMSAVGRGVPGLSSRFRRLPLDAALPATTAVRQARTIAIARRADLHAAFPILASDPLTAAAHGALDVPLLRGGEPLGVLAFRFDRDDAFEASDVRFAELLAGVCAQALERARAYQAEQAARRAAEDRDERLALALGSVQAGTWEVDLRSGEFAWSDAVAELHGTDAGSTPRGLPAYLALIHPDDRERIAAAFARAVEQRAEPGDGDRFDEEFRISRPDGEVRWTNWVGRTLAGSDGRPARMIGIARDVSSRRVAQAEREAFVAGEREANQLRDAFIGVVSHELRTPITTIYGGARVLARSSLRQEQRAEVLDGILVESERLRRLVEDLLVLSRAERRRLEVADDPVLIGHLVNRVVGEEAARWPDRRFERDVPANLPAASGEETYVEQVMRNLLSNAAKYSPTGSTITVRASGQADELQVEVSDEGPGLHDDEVDRVFDLFYRSPVTAARAAGAGIGLFVTRRLIEAMHGRVWVRPNADRGSTFGFSLPIHDEWRNLGER